MATPHVSFTVSEKEMKIIRVLARRAHALAALIYTDYSVLDASMDITACHANGCSLDLAGLLRARDPDFAHDVFGIRRHIDRKSGKLGGYFVPRYAKREVTP